LKVDKKQLDHRPKFNAIPDSMKALKKEAILNTHKIMLKKNPQDKEALDMILKIKLEVLENE